ncbi:MAG: hypothetical protein WDO15_19620 [Bacteroidota bacterium]
MLKKIVWAFFELTTIGPGTYILVTTLTNDYDVDNETAGLGAFLIVLGLLIRKLANDPFQK